MRCGFIFTNFNNSEYTIAAIESIFACDWDVLPDVVVVDNDSDAADKKALAEISKISNNISIIYNDRNVGYFSGLNDGLSALPRYEADYSAVIIGNNDLLFDDKFPEQLNSISKILQDYPVVAPDIVTLDGDHQNPHVLVEPTRAREFLWDLYYSYYWIARLMGHIARITRRFSGRTDHQVWDQSGEILQGYGACYILGPIFFNRLRRLYSPTFLMGEEYFLQYQLEEIGYRTFYDPRIRVYHVDHASTGLVSNKVIWNYGKIAHKKYRALSSRIKVSD